MYPRGCLLSYIMNITKLEYFTPEVNVVELMTESSILSSSGTDSSLLEPGEDF